MDRYIITKLQDAYLWVYDWTGVYVASLAVGFFLFGKVISGFTLDPVSLLLTIFNIVILIPAYIEQDKNQILMYNARALSYQTMMPRKLLTAFVAGLTAGEIVFHEYADAVYGVCIILYVYLLTVCIREREPKEWFKQRKLATVDHTS